MTVIRSFFASGGVEIPSNQQMGDAPKLRVYTDGNCAFCWWARGLIEPRDLDHRIDFRDFNDPAIAAETPYSRPQLLTEMHVLTPEGQWYAGFWGWITILRVLPGKRWLAILLGLPPFRWIGPATYGLLARNRYRIPEWLLRAIGAPQPCHSACDVPVQPKSARP